MRLTVTHAVPAFDMSHGRDAHGEYTLIHWPAALGYCPLVEDRLAALSGDALIIYDIGQASVIAFKGFDAQTLAMMQDSRIFMTERVGEAFVHHPVQWPKTQDDIKVDTTAMV